MKKKSLLAKLKFKTPYRPSAPIKPTEYHEVGHDLVDYCGHYDTYDLEGLIKKLPKGFDASSLRFSVVETDTDHYGYGGYYHFNIEYVEKKKNTKYETQFRKYEKELAKYEADLAIYEAWEKERKLKDEANELRRLKKRIQELEKKK